MTKQLLNKLLPLPDSEYPKKNGIRVLDRVSKGSYLSCGGESFNRRLDLKKNKGNTIQYDICLIFSWSVDYYLRHIKYM